MNANHAGNSTASAPTLISTVRDRINAARADGYKIGFREGSKSTGFVSQAELEEAARKAHSRGILVGSGIGAFILSVTIAFVMTVIS